MAAKWEKKEGNQGELTFEIGADMSKEEGGRHTPFFSNYRPQFYFHTTDITGVIELPDGVEMVMPGDNVTFTVELIQPAAIEKGTKFTVREGGHTVGAGVVSEIDD